MGLTGCEEKVATRDEARVSFARGRAMFAVRVVVVFLTGPVAGRMWWIFLLAAAAGAVVAMCFRRAD